MNNVDVVIVEPKTGFLDYASKRLPLGVMSVAGMIRSKGFKVKIIDQRIDPHGWKKELEYCVNQNPLFVGISSMTGTQINHALKAASVVRNIDNKTPIVWGGVHPSLMALQTIEHPLVDVIVMGEGERSASQLADAYKNNIPLENIPSICYKKNDGTVKVTDSAPQIKLDEIPEIPYDLVDMDEYASIDFSGNHERSISFESSRGCPWRCGFCYIPAFYNSTWRTFSPESIIERLSILKDKYKIKSVYFVDDEMAIDTKRFEKIVDAILKENLDITWGTQGIRIDTMERIMTRHPNLLDKMYKSGNKQIEIGLESGSQRVLKLIDKDIDLETMKRITDKLTDFSVGKDITLHYNMMGGFPTETRDEIEESIKWGEYLVNEKQAYVNYNIFAPFPGTPLYPLSVKSGFVEPKDLESWGDFNLFDWFRHHPSWMDSKTIDFLTSMAFSLLFANTSMEIKITNKVTRTLFKMYGPVARFRLKHRLFNFFIEKRITDLLNMNSDF